MAKKTSLDEFLFKPLLIRTSGYESLVLIYANEIRTEYTISPEGKKTKDVQQILRLVDIRQSIALGVPVLETHIADVEKFIPALTVCEVSDCLTDLMKLSSLILDHTQSLQSELEELGNVISSLRSLNYNQKEASIVLGGTQEPLAQIVFETVTGKSFDLRKLLSRQDIERVAGTLLEVVFSHTKSDLEDQEVVKKLKAEIEYKIIDSLPDNVKAGDVSINMDGVIREINKIRQQSDDKETEQ